MPDQVDIPPTTTTPPAPLGQRRPPTAALPAQRREARAISSVPPSAPPIEHLGRPGVASRLVPGEKKSRRLSGEVALQLTTAVARLVMLVVGTVVASDAGQSANGRLALVLALVLLVGRAIRPARTLPGIALDALVTAGVLAAGAGTFGAYMLFAAATAFAAGSTVGMAPGMAVAGALAAVAVIAGPGVSDVTVTNETEQTPQQVAEAVKQVKQQNNQAALAVSLYALAAALGGLLVLRDERDERAGQATLLETNRILADLERLTVAAPNTLSPAKVANESAAEFLRVLRGRVALVLFEREGTLLELGRAGPDDAGPHLVLDGGWEDLVRSGEPRRLDVGAFPIQLTRQLPVMSSWTAIPLRARSNRVGLVLVGGSDVQDKRVFREVLPDLALETAVALDNTQLFARIEQAASAAERQRLARDLHDGVAQQLTHVRFELELLARQSADPTTRSELQRLARVAHSVTDDVRAAIRGLRAAALDEGLVPALRALVADLDGASGPELELDIRGAAEFDPDVGAELYRIIQEALSNALRHADASQVVVEMDVIDATLVVAVEDDGVGINQSGALGRDGLGLRTMRVRAERIGATFVVRGAEDGGTRIEVRLPLSEAVA